MIKYAHSVRDRPEAEWELLEEHAKAVAQRARTFAADFNGQDIAHLLGMVHDLGKIKPRFQAKLRGEIKELSAHYGASVVLSTATHNRE